MGQKVNPIGLRLGINRTWDSRWYATRGEYARLLHEDLKMREHILTSRKQAGISKVVIERPHKKCRVTVHTARPGILIGKKGADIEKLRRELAAMTDSDVQSAIRMGALGIRINCGGRLGGAEIARMEWYREGRVPLHTLRADIDYGTALGRTAYGIIGVKVWIFKGEIMAHDPMAQEHRALEAQEGGRSTGRREAPQAQA
jgi:small subunit ribosomal protein S3